MLCQAWGEWPWAISEPEGRGFESRPRYSEKPRKCGAFSWPGSSVTRGSCPRYVPKRSRERTQALALPDDAEDLIQLFRHYALLVRVKGELSDGLRRSYAWSAWMLGRGEDHASLRP
jgi:hypothetical protein